jgi:hypothetical protein
VKWRYAVIVLVVLLLAAVRVAVGVPQSPAPSLTLTGQVDIAMGPDGKLLVLVDEATASQPSDGLVEHAFRLQGAESLAYSGHAIVTYTRGRLIVQMSETAGWAFSVAGRTLPPPDPGLTVYTISGIAHLWGEAVHTSPATLFSTFSAGTCSKTTFNSLSGGAMLAAEADGGCKDCQAGGPGASGCSIDCDGGASCEADCGSDSYACCNCQGACGCCSNKEIGGAHH